MKPSEEVRLPDVAHIESELARFWKEAASEQHAVMRACMHNLVVVCDDDADVAAATETIAAVSEQHPGRALLISPAGTAEEGDGLDAFVSTHCHRGPDGSLVCSEQVTLKVRGDSGAELVPETVLHLLEGDCPVFTWWRRATLAGDPLWAELAGMSDRCIVNSAGLAEPVRVVADLAALEANESWRGSAGDLAWVRLEPWREVVASQFDSAFARPYLDSVTAVEIDSGGTASADGTTAAGAYMVGWLATRLGWRLDADRGVWLRSDGAEIDVRLARDAGLSERLLSGVTVEAVHRGRTARFVARRVAPGEDAVRTAIETEGSCPLPLVLQVERAEDVPLLCGELERGFHDDVFEAALDAAARWATARTR